MRFPPRERGTWDVPLTSRTWQRDSLHLSTGPSPRRLLQVSRWSLSPARGMEQVTVLGNATWEEPGVASAYRETGLEPPASKKRKHSALQT